MYSKIKVRDLDDFKDRDTCCGYLMLDTSSSLSCGKHTKYFGSSYSDSVLSKTSECVFYRGTCSLDKEEAEKEKRERAAAEERARKEREAKEAAERLRKAAEQGDASAQFNLGNLYFTGQGVPQDYAKAIEWFGKAAAQGHTEAKDSLAKAEEEKARKAKDAAEREVREANEAAEREAKEKRRKIGRVIAPILMVFFIIMTFVGYTGEGSISNAIILTLFMAIPFLVLYFSSSERKILRGIFLGVGVLLSLWLISFIFTSAPPEDTKPEDITKGVALLIVMCISYMASCITAMIFPKD